MNLGGTLVGHDEVRAFYGELLRALPDMQIDVSRRHATYDSVVLEVGVLPHVIEAVLNHVSGHKAGVAGVYNRSTYAAEKRAALDLWAAHLQVLLAGGNVVKLRAARAVLM
jgi:hypothetical protein